MRRATLPRSRKIQPQRNNVFRNLPRSVIELKIVGFSQITDSDYHMFGKVFWIIAVLASSAIMNYYIGERFVTYFSYPTTTKIEMMANNTVTFPAITLCPAFLYHFIYSNGFGNSPEQKRLFNIMSQSVEVANLSLPMWYKKFFTFPTESIKIYKSCNNLASKSHEQESCKIKDGQEVHLNATKLLTFWGICVGVSMEDPVIFRGPYSFLKVVINATTIFETMWPLFGKLLNENEINIARSFLNSMGLLYHVHPHTHLNSTHDVIYKVSIAKPNTMTEIMLTRKEFIFKNRTSKPCYTPAIVSKCKSRCLEKLLVEKMNCLLLFTNSTFEHSKPICTNGTSMVQAVVTAFSVYQQFEFDCFCSSPCTFMDFASSKLTENVSTNTIELKLYFIEGSYLRVEEIFRYSLRNFIGDVGALMGFFLGICILSILESFDSIFHVIYYWWQGKGTSTVHPLNTK